MAKSFLQRIDPNRVRERLIEWPFPVEGERPKVKMRILGSNEAEAAYLDAIDHFKGRKPKVEMSDPVFQAREKTALVWRAFRDEDGSPLAASIEEMNEQPVEVINALYAEWSAFQADVAAMPVTSEQMSILVDELKKNTLAVPLHVLPSTWLIELSRTLASQLASSTPPNSGGL